MSPSASNWRSSLAEIGYRNPLYRLALIGKAPDHLARLPPDPWPGDPTRGAAILSGQAPGGGRPAWHGPASARALGDWNGFSWLDDLATIEVEAAAARARELLGDWLDRADAWHDVAWAPDVLGRRVAAWLGHARLVGLDHDDELGRRARASLARQLRHLGRVVGAGPEGSGRIAALRGLFLGCLCGLAPESRLDGALKALAGEIQRQVLADGGHIERSPALHVKVLADLIDIALALEDAKLDVPLSLAAAIERMAATARLFRHGDGGLAHFNDSQAGERAFLDRVLQRAGPKLPAPLAAPDTGFQRLVAQGTLVIVDAGAPPPAGFDTHAHAGTLSFEMSLGRERLIVNCGALASPDGVWDTAQRSTAAHSTATLDDTNSSEIVANGLGRRPARVTRARDDHEGATWLTLSHDGYAEPFGAIHHRRLYLSADGGDLRGEDAIDGRHAGTLALRFHLHPDVQVSIVQNGAAALLRVRSGAAWRFAANPGPVALAESIYLDGAAPRRCEQLVVTGEIIPGRNTFKWSLKRVATTG